MTRCIEPTAVTPPVAASRPRAGAAIPQRYSGVAVAALLLLTLSATPIKAQPRPAAIRAHVGGATFFEAARHFNPGASYRKYFGARGWAIEPEYAFMTEGSHQDHMLILNASPGPTSSSRASATSTWTRSTSSCRGGSDETETPRRRDLRRRAAQAAPVP